MKTVFLKYLLLLWVVCLSSCNKVAVTGEGLTHKQANHIIAVLSTQGISANATKSGRKASDGYQVVVKRNKYLEAVQILDDNGLPEEEDRSYKYLNYDNNFLAVNSKEIEALKSDRALAVQLEELLTNHNGVSSAKVMLRQASVAPDSVGVAVVLKTRNSSVLTANEVTELVKIVVPELASEKIKVLISSEQEQKVFVNGVEVENGKILKVPLESLLYWNVAEGDEVALISFFFVMVALSGFVCFVIGYSFSNQKKNQKILLLMM